MVLRDLASSNGIFINDVHYGEGEPLQEKRLEDGDVVRIDLCGAEEVSEEAVLLIYRCMEEELSHWVCLSLDKGNGQFCVGRNESYSDICLKDERVSRMHAVFYRAADGWAVKDCESANGVFLNHRQITCPRYLRPLDCVQISDVVFVFRKNQILIGACPDCVSVRSRTKPGGTEKFPSGKALSIHIKKRTAKQGLKTITLLKDIDLTVQPGEFVLVLGGSGAGKTTFLNAVMGYEPAEGRILHGNVDVYTNYQQMKYEIGFVPQDILLRESDSVYDTLYNAAQMKMPSSATAEQRQERVAQVLDMVNLKHIARSLIKSISGGEKKRVSAGVELVANPSLFFLDEPDSGLDAQSAIELMENLRGIADIGKIVMLISHSPDRVAELFDKVVVLAKSAVDMSGHLAFYGSVEETYRFFGVENLEGVISKINARDGQGEFFIEKWRQANGG